MKNYKYIYISLKEHRLCHYEEPSKLPKPPEETKRKSTIDETLECIEAAQKLLDEKIRVLAQREKELEAREKALEAKSPQEKETVAKPEKKEEVKNIETVYDNFVRNFEEVKKKPNQWVHCKLTGGYEAEWAYVPEQKHLYSRSKNGVYSVTNPVRAIAEKNSFPWVQLAFLEDIPNIPTLRDTQYHKAVNAPLEIPDIWKARCAEAMNTLRRNQWGTISTGRLGYEYAWYVPEGEEEGKAQFYERDAEGVYHRLSLDGRIWEYCWQKVPVPQELHDNRYDKDRSRRRLFTSDVPETPEEREQRIVRYIRMMNLLRDVKAVPGTFIHSGTSADFYLYDSESKKYYSIDPHWRTTEVFIVASLSWSKNIPPEISTRIWSEHRATLKRMATDINNQRMREKY